MPKSFRKCALCEHNSYTHPESIIFTHKIYGFVCENHFNEEDMRSHGSSKRQVLLEIAYLLPCVAINPKTVNFECIL